MTDQLGMFDPVPRERPEPIGDHEPVYLLRLVDDEWTGYDEVWYRREAEAVIRRAPAHFVYKITPTTKDN